MISNFLKLHHFGELWILFETIIFTFTLSSDLKVGKSSKQGV